MKKIASLALLAGALAAVTVGAVTPASARDRHRDNDDAALMGIMGLAAGTVVGATIASQPRYVEVDPVYVEPAYPPPLVYHRPAPVYVTEYPPAPAYVELEPWSPEWYRYCSDRYRSFDPRSGTYVGFDGREHFCAAGG